MFQFLLFWIICRKKTKLLTPKLNPTLEIPRIYIASENFPDIEQKYDKPSGKIMISRKIYV